MKAIAGINHVFWEGLQVEWLECEQFLAWQLVCEQSAMQMQAQCSPHILGAAVQYVQSLK